MDQFRANLRGVLFKSGDPGYEDARKVYNGIIDKRPRYIARCEDTADVIYTVNFARENGLLTAMRGGGHNGAGFGICDDGLIINLSRMKGVRVDPAAGEVRVQGGCVWGEVDQATHAFGMAVPCGFISTTGVGGLTLGGGIGYLTRTYGLTNDNLLAADVVLADGRLIKASPKENPDLFWALRGGGDNFRMRRMIPRCLVHDLNSGILDTRDVVPPDVADLIRLQVAQCLHRRFVNWRINHLRTQLNTATEFRNRDYFVPVKRDFRGRASSTGEGRPENHTRGAYDNGFWDTAI